MTFSGAGRLGVQIALLAPDTWCVRVGGPIEDADIETLEAALRGIACSEGSRLVVNLEKVGHVSPEGLRWILRTHFTGVKNGVRIFFAACPPPLNEVLGQVGLSRILHFASDERSALAQE
jgi:anti-anti-sigma regulatory factor